MAAFEILDDAPKGRFEVLDAPASGGAAFGVFPQAGNRQTQNNSGMGDRLYLGIPRGMKDSIDGLAQLTMHALPQGAQDAVTGANNWLANKTGAVAPIPAGGLDQLIRNDEQAYQEQRGAGGVDPGRLLGNVLSPTNVAIAGMLPRAAGLLGRVATGAAGGALSGLVTPVTQGDFAEEKMKQAKVGAGFGTAAPLVGSALARIVSPNASTNPALQTLTAEGVRPTIGQTLGGLANTLEQKAMSIPGLGDMIGRARNQSIQDFNAAAINRATAPIGVRVPGTGNDAVREAGDAIGDAYTQARNRLGSFQIDQQGAQDLQRIHAMAAQLPERERRAFDQTWQAVRTDISNNATVDANVFKRIDSRLENDASRFGKSTDAYQQNLGAAFGELRDAITGAGRRANPEADALFTAADSAYANLVRVEGAAKSAMNREGVFSPAQLNSAVRGADDSVRRRASARGTALMQDLSGPGQTILGSTVPDSGTAGRVMAGGLLAGGGALSLPVTAGLLGGGSLLYTNPLQALLRGSVMARPQVAQPIANTLRQGSPLLAPAAGQVGLGLFQ